MEQIKIRENIKKIFKEIYDYSKTQEYLDIDNENISYLLLNNGNKYYIYLQLDSETNESRVYIFEQNNILNEICITIKKSDINWNILKDFNIGLKKNCYLLEGYLFENDMFFSDIIYPYYKLNYTKRRDIIKNIINKENRVVPYIIQYRGKDIILGKIMNVIKQEKDEISCLNKTFENLMRVNFKYNNELSNSNLIFEKNIIKMDLKVEKVKREIELKEITRGKKIELYNVYNINSKNFEGILLIKTLKESKYIKNLFKNEEKLELMCKYNNDKKKWCLDIYSCKESAIV